MRFYDNNIIIKIFGSLYMPKYLQYKNNYIFHCLIYNKLGRFKVKHSPRIS